MFFVLFFALFLVVAAPLSLSIIASGTEHAASLLHADYLMQLGRPDGKLVRQSDPRLALSPPLLELDGALGFIYSLSIVITVSRFGLVVRR